MEHRLNFLETETSRPQINQHHIRPLVSPIFVGRTKQLTTLKNCLHKEGSALITGYGWLGETQLMVAFAAIAKQEADPVQVFRVSVDGVAESVLRTLKHFGIEMNNETVTAMNGRT